MRAQEQCSLYVSQKTYKKKSTLPYFEMWWRYLVYAEKRLQRMISLRPFFYINICECVRQIQYK